jgi:pimeloyl-ACP methyl ester carboxylesterase
MQPLADHLRTERRVLNVELRGHGRSGGPTSASMHELASDVLAVVALIRAPVILIGHSLGGRVALAAAARRPDLVPKLVMLDSAIEEDAAYVAQRRSDVEDSFPAGLRERFLALFGPRADAAQPIIERMLRTPRQAALDALAASDDFDAAAGLRAYRGDALYIGASNPRAERRRLEELQPDLSYGQVVGSGHFIQIEATAQVTAMIDRFLELAAD